MLSLLLLKCQGHPTIRPFWKINISLLFCPFASTEVFIYVLLTLIYRRWSSEPTQPTQASAGRSFSDKLTEQFACLEAQREFIFYLFFQEMVLLLSFFIFLKTNYRISSYSFRRNYSFLNLEIQRSQSKQST